MIYCPRSIKVTNVCVHNLLVPWQTHRWQWVQLLYHTLKPVYNSDCVNESCSVPINLGSLSPTNTKLELLA